MFDIRRYSIHDGPGIRTTVFLKGCALSCWWCHNPEGQSPRPEVTLRDGRCIRCGACVEACDRGAASLTETGPAADRSSCDGCESHACAAVCYAEAREVAGRPMSVEQVIAVAARDTPFYEESGGGVTLSGGEPLLQAEFTAALLAALKARGIHTALDTCGHAPWEAIERLRGDVDLFLFPRTSTSNRYPVSGKIVRDVTLQATFKSATRSSTTDVTKRVEVDFNGTVSVNPLIDGKTCTLNLLTRRVGNCQ